MVELPQGTKDRKYSNKTEEIYGIVDRWVLLEQTSPVILNEEEKKQLIAHLCIMCRVGSNKVKDVIEQYINNGKIVLLVKE